MTLFSVGLVCGKKNALAPFKKLPSSQEMLFKKNHIPPDIIFPNDPSHMKVEQAWHFLEFVCKRQRKFPNDVFGLRYWFNNKGKLADPVRTKDAENGEDIDGGSDDTAEVEHLLPVHHNVKGKQKADNELAKRKKYRVATPVLRT